MRHQVRGSPRPLALLVVLLVLVAACGQAVRSAPTVIDGTVDIGDQTRRYRLFTPSLGPDDAVPLVVMLHDAFGDAAGIAETTQFDREASAGRFAVVYPEAVDRLWNGLYCCGEARRQGIDDLGFLDALLDRLLADHPIDADRVYAAGISNGAVMAQAMGCALGDRVRAVAAVAGTFDLGVCEPTAPVSVLAINGTADPLVPYEGGDLPGRIESGPAPSLPELAAEWAAHDGCDPEPAATTEAPVRTDEWTGCDGDTRVTLITIEGGGHTWFAPEFGEIDGSVDATSEIARFFELR